MYCRYCGKEVRDEAFVCPACGCLTGLNYPQSEQEKQEQAKRVADAKEVDNFFAGEQKTAEQPQPTAQTQPVGDKKATLSKVFSIISLVFSGITAFLLLLAFGCSLSYTETGLAGFALCWLYGVMTSEIALGTGIAGFVLGRIQKSSQTVKNLSKWAFIICLIGFASAIGFIFSPIFYI